MEGEQLSRFMRRKQLERGYFLKSCAIASLQKMSLAIYFDDRLYNQALTLAQEKENG